MKFKHSLNVFIDNFSVTYKQLLYRLIITVLASALMITCLYPFVHEMINSSAFTSLVENVKNFVSGLLKGEVGNLSEISGKITESYKQVFVLLETRMVQIVLSALLLLLVYIAEKWFMGLGNYTTAVIVNDKMALRATSPFVGTMISHLKEACIYNLIYVPLSILYDIVVFVLLFAILHMLMINIPWFFFSVFLFALLVIMSLAVKMTFTSDWLPALIRGKMTNKAAIAYSFKRQGKNTLNVLSNYVVIILVILATNMFAAVFTFGVGILLTIPSSYILIISFEFVNYYDREEIRYFVDKNTIVKPEKEHIITREEFFKGLDGEDQ